MDKSKIISKIVEHYKFKSDADFARHLGIKPQVLSNWKSRGTYDVELIYTKCLELNPEWLLTGRGEMLKSEEKLSILPKSDTSTGVGSELMQHQKEIIELQRDKIKTLEEKLKDCEGKIFKDVRVPGDV